ncbi:hypothetical protein QOT17_004619 [Balamuthia mandrillaris]
MERNNVLQRAGVLPGITSDDPAARYDATKRCRLLLCQDENQETVQQVLDADVLPRLLQSMSLQEDKPELTFESCWALSSMASCGSSSQLQALVERGALPTLINLLSSSNPQLQEQACTAIGFIAKAGEQLRDHCLASGALDAVVASLTHCGQLSVLRQAAWTLSILCSHNLRDSASSPANWGFVKKALPTLCRLLYSQDEEVLTDTTWALAYLTDERRANQLDEVTQAGVVRPLMQLAKTSRSTAVLCPVVKILANFADGHDLHRQLLLNQGLLPLLSSSLLAHPKISIQVDAFRALANMATGNGDQLQAILDSNLWSCLVTSLEAGGPLVGGTPVDPRVRKEIVRAIHNFASACHSSQLLRILSSSLIQALCDLLDFRNRAVEDTVLQTVLETLEHLLPAHEAVAELIESAGGLDWIEELQAHQNNEIYETALRILETYYVGEEEEEDEAMEGFVVL